MDMRYLYTFEVYNYEICHYLCLMPSANAIQASYQNHTPVRGACCHHIFEPQRNRLYIKVL